MPGITRRDFLGGAAAAPIIAATANLALGAVLPDPDTGADLIFILSDDEKSVAVRRVSTDTSVTYRDWTLEVASFGPDAWFDMHPEEYASWDSKAQALRTVDGALRRQLNVRGASWGRHVKDVRDQLLEVTFVFERRDDKPWTVGIETNVWSSVSGNPAFRKEANNRLDLHSFIIDRTRLVETLSQGSIQQTLGSMFDGQVAVRDRMKVGFNADLQWVVEPNSQGDRPITALDGAVEAPALEADNKRSGLFVVQWERRAGGDLGGAGRRLTAHSLAEWAASFRFIGNRETPTITIAPPQQEAALVGDLFIGQLDPNSRLVSEGGADSASVVALFAAVGGVLDCQLSVNTETSLPICTDLPLNDVMITRIATGTEKGGWRDVMIADAGGRRSAPPSESSPDKPTGPQPQAETVRIATLVGRMAVAPLPIDTAAIANQGDQVEDAALAAQRKFDAVLATALGDRAGVSERTFFLLADRRRGADGLSSAATEDSDVLRRLYADVALHGIDTALPDTRDSSLSVAGSHFRFNYVDGSPLPGLVVPEVHWNTPDGYLWLGAPTLSGEFAWLDLGSSTLQAHRDYDLVDVRFRFTDLVLGFSVSTNESGEPIGIGRSLRPSSPDARQTVVRKQLPEYGNGSSGKLGLEDEVSDRRPVLAVEFPPQHVMEEAFYRQELGPLPDTAWPKDSGDLESFLTMLRAEPDAKKRADARKAVGEKKEVLETEQSKEATDSEPPFAALRKLLLATSSLPEDQKQYFGPYSMSPEAIKVARAWQLQNSDKMLSPIVAKMLVEAAKVQPANVATWELRELLQAEADAEKVFPLYKLWRDAFRAYVIETRGETSDAATGDPDKLFAEFINRQRVPVPSEYLPSPELEAQFTAAFLKQISGREPYDQLAMARLSGRSLLAFRVNFEAAPGDSAEVNDLPGYPTDNPAALGPGVQRFGAIPFTFAALTNWSRHEPHVTQRARKLYEPLASGTIPPVAGRVASVDDHAILVQQGFEPGAKPSESHLGQVRANLTKRPKGLETRIEIPSRLILSTAQNAIWQSPRKVSRDAPEGVEPDVFDTDPPPDGNRYEAYEPLWTARLITEDAEPSLRAVWSPDVRPEAIGFIPVGSDGVPRIAGPPPRGPWAPWILRREQVDGVRLHPAKVKEADQASKPTGSAAAPPPEETDEIACRVPTSGELINRNPTPTMFERICEIFRIRARYYNQPDLHTFRTSLDAYDRHELVLLSSAYGLPVTGRRRQIGDNDTDGGELIEKSGQFEPGTDFHLTDATPDLAYYRPKPLDVSELSLSAIGGFLNHDTNFLPPAPAVTYDGRSLFDGLSIERWQHLIVLGRDVLATVVYSGYLYPLGHKASLVKITERIFVRMKGDRPNDEDFGVKAVLRQRMFVRVSSPTKKFPAVGQPNKGRQWCSEDVTMLTRETPDIVDPTLEIDTPPSGASLSGRIFLDNQPGLAFWPQTATTEQARFRFEFTLDGRRTKMPLIFVDRIAAKNKTALDALLKYYRSLDEAAWRKARLNGQTLRFAEPVKEGDTSFAVDSIVLDVDGRSVSDGKSWEGQNDLMTNTGVLEGADQPAFYPVMSSANIHIEQAECMSGAAMGPARVRFDGSYVLRGLPRRSEEEPGAQAQDNETLAGNAAEVFLFVDMPAPPKMSMGPNGNQSGGVGRPNMDIIALSRSKGILGAQPGQKIYRRGPSDTATAYAPWPKLLSVAAQFSLPAPQPPPPEGGPPAVPPASEETTSAVFESFFSADAKLLGVISFQSLMKLLKLAGGVDAMPALKEVIDYGSQALAQLQQGAAGAIDLLHSEILAPLLQLVRTARKEWSRLDRSQVGLQESAIGQFQQILPNFKATSLRTLYPEIDRGLNKLEAALLDAMGETDPIVIVGRLAAVHEAGRQFMRELARLAANPVERIEQAARGQFDTVAGDIQAEIKAYEHATKKFVDALQATKEDIARELLIYLADQLPWDEIEALRAISKSGEAIFDLSTSALAELRAVNVDLTGIVSRLASGELEPKAALKQTTATFLDVAIASAKETEAGLRNPSIAQKFLDLFNGYTPADRTIVAEAVLAYRRRLEGAKAKMDGWIDGVPSTPEWGIWVARVRAIVQLIELLRELVRAVSADRPDRVFALLVQLGRDYLNIDLLAFQTEIKDKIKAREAQLRAWIENILGRLVQVATGPFASKTQIDPELPAAVTAACIAKLPADDEVQAKAVADAIEGLTPDHFLAGFARSAADTFKLAGDLVAAQGTLPPGSAADSVRSAITDFNKALPTYRRLFCEVVAVAGHAQSVHHELAALSQGQGTPPVMTPEAMLAAADRLRVLAGEVEQGLRRIRTESESLFDLLGDHLAVIVSAAAAGALASAFGNDLKDALNRWDKAAASALRVALTTLFRWTSVVATLASSEVGDLLKLASEIVRKRVPDVLRTEREDLAVSLETLDGDCRELAVLIAGLGLPTPLADETVKQLLDAKVDGAITVSQLFKGESGLARTDKIERALQRVSVSYAALLSRARGLPESLAGQALDAPVEQLFKALQGGYAKILELRNALVDKAKEYTVAGPAIQKALTVEPFLGVCNPLKTDCDKLAREKAAVDRLLKPTPPLTEPKLISTKRSELQTFLDSVSGGHSAVEKIFDNIQRIWDDISRGELSSLVDIAALRDQVEELISELVPVKRTLSYSLGFDFDGGKIAKMTGGVFTPKPPSRFELAMTATINLIKVEADMNAKGRIGPFDVNLLGNVFDAVTLIFDGVEFGFELGGSPRFDVHYRDFKIGKKLEFVKKLQSYMTPSKDGSGFFIEPMRGRPGILAGYGINLGTIQLGGVAFSNVLLNAAAELPFDGEAALFRFALGRPMAPFLISVPPYGGGGFVAIYADAQGFRGFEASFEFGGVADFSTGPLVARGRLTSGFYIRSMQVESEGKRRTLTDIYGTFFVGGEASIWIFSFYASLYVRLGMKAGGDMEGEATFTFSFSMGIIDYDFQVSVSHKRKAFGGGGTNSIGSASSSGGQGVDRSIITRTIPKGGQPTKATAPNIEANTTPFGEATIADYLAYFDPALLKPETRQ
ncbi:twin-arginine translocation signal domain-containing protein [Mesorhizobium sp. M1066]|uniref:twin-arginine translocation signal domain-containing protein n=1 Tax=unclassified Mesorhizobium TaxID=325217 RepID=UPI00333A536B